MLCFQAQTEAMSVNLAALSCNSSVQKIAGIKLDTGLISQNLQHAPARGFVHLRPLHHFLTFTVEHPIVVVAVALFDLIVVGIYSCANGGGFAEVKWRSFN